MLEEALQDFVGRGHVVELMVGLDGVATEPQAVERLAQICSGGSNAVLYCYASFDSAVLYHPKLYLFRSEKSARAIVGSSNLTRGGLMSNVEVNLMVDGATTDPAIDALFEAYVALKQDPARLVPDEEFLALYGELHRRRLRQRQREEGSTTDLRQRLREKARSLARPTVRRADLTGWAELVYNALPEGEFKTRDMYRHETEFQTVYPGNRKVREKIRQQLQWLRDLGLLEHIARGRWRKAGSAPK